MIEEENTDLELIEKILDGNLNALEQLILHHQCWIYNIAFRMIGDAYEAEDITQEILIKILTKISTFDSTKSAFRTWLYRIVINHVLNLKRSKKEALMVTAVKTGNFEEYINEYGNTKVQSNIEKRLILEEIKQACFQCITLCLKRRERIVFILSGVFEVSDKVGSEICEISRENYRQILSRSRKKIFHFFDTNCSLVDPHNPCKCSDKMDIMLKLGIIQPSHPIVQKESSDHIKAMLANSMKDISDSYYEFNMLFNHQPFLEPPDMLHWLNQFLNKKNMKNYLNLG